MKAYKLLKKYPSLPESIKEGQIVMKSESGYVLKSMGTSNAIIISEDEVENHPEFWEDISGDLKCIIIFHNEPHIIIEDLIYNNILVWRCRANEKNIIPHSETYDRKYFEKNSDMYFWIAEELRKLEENS